MGIYLSNPKTEKSLDKGEDSQVKWAAMGMQGNFVTAGWRTKMEDSHIAQTGLANNVSVFGVFDGHGGAEVAIFVKKHFTATLIKNENFIKSDYKKALHETFIKMDELLRTKEGIKELKEYKENEEEQSYAGCTANVVLLTKTEIYVANSGDSRSIIKSGNVHILDRKRRRCPWTTSRNCRKS